MRNEALNAMLGKSYGLLTVVDFKQNKDGHWRCVCLCQCGGARIANHKKLLDGRTSHCGCLATMRNRIYHTSYFVWQTMLQRCNNPNDGSYKDYGGRGIKICEEWETFIGFLTTFPKRPNKDFQIDRINVNGNYEPQNCRWIHKTTNATYNKRNTLQEYEVSEIRTFLNRGVSMKKIAIFYDTKVWTIRRILNNESYLKNKT